MKYYLHAYIRDAVTGKETPIQLEDPRVGFRGVPSGGAAVAGQAKMSAPLPNAVSFSAIEKEINRILANFYVRPPDGRTTGGISRSKIAKLQSDIQKTGDNDGEKTKILESLRAEAKPKKGKLCSWSIEFDNGYMFFLHDPENPEKMFDTERAKAAIWDLFFCLDDFMGEVSYKITSGDVNATIVMEVEEDPAPPGAAGVVATGSGAATSTSKTIQVFQDLKRASIYDRTEYRPQKNEKEYLDKTFMYTPETKGWPQGWPGRFNILALNENSVFCAKDRNINKVFSKLYFKSIKQTIETSSGKKQYEGFAPNKKLYALWVPRVINEYFFDNDEDHTSSILKSRLDVEKFRLSQEKEQEKEPRRQDAWVYAFDGKDGKLSMLNFIVSEHSRGGGGGAMRSDRPGDGDYRWWTTTDDQRLLGLSFGLDPDKRVDPRKEATAAKDEIPSFKDFLEVRLPQSAKGLRKPTTYPMESEIIYWKKFPDKVEELKKKKNKPQDVLPLPARALTREEASGLYTKKRKGGWSGSGKLPITIGGPRGAREDAGKVMRQAFQEQGIFGKIDAGRATLFAEAVVSEGLAKTAWINRSKAPQSDQASNVVAGASTDEKSYPVRTDQEWCHLVGHGDGGGEVFENFVSGSKHCNTEQLAIEIGQRTGRAVYSALLKEANKPAIELAVKVSAYLLPSEERLKPNPRDRVDKASWETLKVLDLIPQQPVGDKEGAPTAEGGAGKRDEKTYRLPEGIVEKIREILSVYDKYIEEQASIATSGNATSVDPFRKGLEKNAKEKFKEWETREKLKLERMKESSAASSKKTSGRTAYRNGVSQEIRENLKAIVNYPQYPLANFIRYKIFRKISKDEYEKIFDHTFDAQNESFDFFEYKIIESTVRRVVAAAADCEDSYRTNIKLKVERLAISNPKVKAAMDNNANERADG